MENLSWAQIILSLAGASWRQTRHEEYDYVSPDERGMRTAVYVHGVWSFVLKDGSVITRNAGGDTEDHDWSYLPDTLRYKLYREEDSPEKTEAISRLEAITSANPRNWRERTRFGDFVLIGMFKISGEPFEALKEKIDRQIESIGHSGTIPEASWEPEALEVVANNLLVENRAFQEKAWRVVKEHTDLIQTLEVLKGVSEFEGNIPTREVSRRYFWSIIQDAPRVREHNKQAMEKIHATLVERAISAEEARRAEVAKEKAAALATLEKEAQRLGMTVRVRTLPWILTNVTPEEAEEKTGLTAGSGIGPKDPRPGKKFLPGDGQLIGQVFHLSGSRWSWEITWEGDVRRLCGDYAPTNGGRKHTFDSWTVAVGPWMMIAVQKRDDSPTAVRVADPSGWVEAHLSDGKPVFGSSMLRWRVSGEPMSESEAKALLSRAGFGYPEENTPLVNRVFTDNTPTKPATVADLASKFNRRKKLFFCGSGRIDPVSVTMSNSLFQKIDPPLPSFWNLDNDRSTCVGFTVRFSSKELATEWWNAYKRADPTARILFSYPCDLGWQIRANTANPSTFQHFIRKNRGLHRHECIRIRVFREGLPSRSGHRGDGRAKCWYQRLAPIGIFPASYRPVLDRGQESDDPHHEDQGFLLSSYPLE